MAKKNKKEKKSSTKSEEKKKPQITMEDLDEMSGDELPPEDEWDEDTKALKDAILGGAYDHLLKREDGGAEDDDDESIEEIEVRSTDDEGEEEHDSENEPEVDHEEAEEVDDDDEHSGSSEEASDLENEDEEEHDEKQEDEEEKVDGSDDDEDSDNDDSDNDDDEDDDKESEFKKSSKEQGGSKALHIITNQLIAEKAKWPWAETFSIVSQTPLPFNVEGEEQVDIHDDLKREVAFYDMALESVFQAREQCKKAGVPITRPADFFAEMVKSDGALQEVIVRAYIIRVLLFSLTYTTLWLHRTHGSCQRPSHFWNQKDWCCQPT